LAAIGQGIVERYVTDFPEDELLGNPAVIPVPHLGASTPEAEENCAVMSVKQTKAFLEEGTIYNSVNYPACSMDRGNGARLLITNRNIPNMLSQILAALADNNINVDDMVNKHRDSIAYNIIDVTQPVVAENCIKKIIAVDGIIRVRVLNKGE